MPGRGNSAGIVVWGQPIEIDASVPEPLIEAWVRAVDAYVEHGVLPPVHRIAVVPVTAGEQQQ